MKKVAEAYHRRRAKHSTAPWYHKQTEDTKRYYRVRGGGFDNGDVAMVAKKGKGQENLRLILAAPKMLHAIKCALAVIHEDHPAEWQHRILVEALTAAEDASC